MISPTCGESRSSACSASGVPRWFCRPLSTPPIRAPRPPARIRPVISSRGIIESTADVMHLDAGLLGSGCWCSRRAPQLRIAVVARVPDQADRGGDLRVAEVAAQQRAQVVPAAREQAEEQLAFGRQAGAVAVGAERL